MSQMPLPLALLATLALAACGDIDQDRIEVGMEAGGAPASVAPGGPASHDMDECESFPSRC